MSIIKLTDHLTRILMVLAAGWAFILTFIIIADIIGRTVFNSPVYGVPEIVMNSIVMIVFLQAGFVITVFDKGVVERFQTAQPGQRDPCRQARVLLVLAQRKNVVRFLQLRCQ